MDCTEHTFYHIHGMDSRDLSDLYCSVKEDMVFRDDILIFPMANLHYQLSSGRVSGNTLIDISIGSFIHHLYSACNSFQDIVVLKSSEKCIMELSRWLHDRTGAYDWTHTSAAAAELEGNRDQHQEKESRLKSSIKQILKCDFEEENITSPVELPLADCVISVWILETISKNEDEYMRNLEKILKLLKPGGELLLFSVTHATYFTAGGERFHGFTHDESFVNNALSKLGLVIDYCSVQRRHNVSDLTDYKAIMFTVARKGGVGSICVIGIWITSSETFIQDRPDLQATTERQPDLRVSTPPRDTTVVHREPTLCVKRTCVRLLSCQRSLSANHHFTMHENMLTHFIRFASSGQ
ncbi:indolethylamine N-methyltransferase-like [Mantella aurantiaca]